MNLLQCTFVIVWPHWVDEGTVPVVVMACMRRGFLGSWGAVKQDSLGLCDADLKSFGLLMRSSMSSLISINCFTSLLILFCVEVGASTFMRKTSGQTLVGNILCSKYESFPKCYSHVGLRPLWAGSDAPNHIRTTLT